MCQTKAQGGKRCYKAPSYKSIFTQKQFDQMLADKMVHIHRDNDLPLAVLKYTKPAVYTQTWNDVTMNCRGLVIDTDTGEVLARPYSKFYNYNEPSCPQVDWDEEVVVMNKEDGSLGVYVEKYNMLCTPGSSKSEQAIEGTKMLRERDDFTPVKGRTYMFEIIYPELENILDYGDRRDLILLGARDTKTGEVIDVDDIPEWTGTKVEKIPARTLREAIAMPPRENAEGFVVRFKDGTMVKVKQQDYVELHRKLSNLSPRLIWEHSYARSMIAAGMSKDQVLSKGVPEPVYDMVVKHDNDPLTALKDEMPEEWYGYIEQHFSTINDGVDERVAQVKQMRSTIPTDITQKERAQYIRDNFERADHGFLMSPNFDEARVRNVIMSTSRPRGDTSALGDDDA